MLNVLKKKKMLESLGINKVALTHDQKQSDMENMIDKKQKEEYFKKPEPSEINKDDEKKKKMLEGLFKLGKK